MAPARSELTIFETAGVQKTAWLVARDRNDGSLYVKSVTTHHRTDGRRLYHYHHFWTFWKQPPVIPAHIRQYATLKLPHLSTRRI